MQNKFYVHIIESPAPEDLLEGRTEGKMLGSFLELTGIPFLYNLAVDKKRLKEALTARISNGVQQFDAAKPIIHISSHGDEEGIQLTSQREEGETIPWLDLGDMLLPINRQFDGIWVCMSCCGGGHAKNMAEVINAKRIPMAWVIGPTENLSWSEGALAFAVFYHRFQQGAERDELLEAMNATTGNGSFIIHHAPKVQRDYIRSVRRKQVDEWLQRHPVRRPLAGRRRRSILFG
jgi:hypothetical protein